MSWLPGPSRFFMQFNLNWTGVSRIVRAQLRVRLNGNPHGFIGSSATVYIDRVTQAWTEGTFGADDVWYPNEAEVYPGPSATSAERVIDSQTGQGVYITIDITPIMNVWAPATVLRSTGTNGGAAANYGIRCISSNEASSTTRSGFDTQESANPATLILTYY